MATTAPPARPVRRAASVSGTATTATRSPPGEDKNPSGTTLVAKGSISRTSPSPKAIPPVRRTTASSRPSSSLSNPREATKDVSPGRIKENGIGKSNPVKDVEESSTQYDELRLRIQDLDGTVSTLATDNAKLQTSLTQAEARLAEFYTEQARMDQELAMRHDVAEKLRGQLREFEKEKRDLTRRYKEQTAAFEAERQSYYDNEQHLKSRIQALSQSRKDHVTPRKPRYSEFDETASIVSEAEFPLPESKAQAQSGPSGGNENSANSQDEVDDNEPAEMTSLKLELSTLSTSHTSLQSTLQLLQAQLLDLQRVNAELQEENEGWKVLVQQRTLSGTFDVLGLGGARNSEDSNVADDASSMKSTSRNTLDKVSEMDEIAYEAELGSGRPSIESGANIVARGRSLDAELAASDPARNGSPSSRHSRRRGKGLGDVTESPKGESLADLPITGPGLDLAAELGRAQNVEGFVDGGHATNTPKKASSAEEKKLKTEIEALKADVKSLKDANKALSLYASKIIDRIIATEGFEDVLAVDFTQKFTNKVKNKRRPANMIFGAGPVAEAPRTAVPAEKLTTFESIRMSQSTATTTNNPPPPPPKPTTPADDPRRSRRSMSFDWRGFSLFGGGGAEAEKKAPEPSLKPLTLRPGAPSLTANPTTMGARKLETVEDEEDLRERERLRATMRLMGINPASEQQAPREPTQPFNPDTSATESGPSTANAAISNRWSLFGRRTTTDSTSASSTSLAQSNSGSPDPPAQLTTEALKQAEAESHLAALDAREKAVKEEIAKGGSSGFTELATLNGGQRRRIGEEWRSRRSSASLGVGDLTITRGMRKEGSSAGSASTVWSAGKDDD